jgi:hypothetical protein
MNGLVSLIVVILAVPVIGRGSECIDVGYSPFLICLGDSFLQMAPRLPGIRQDVNGRYERIPFIRDYIVLLDPLDDGKINAAMFLSYDSVGYLIDFSISYTFQSKHDFDLRNARRFLENGQISKAAGWRYSDLKYMLRSGDVVYSGQVDTSGLFPHVRWRACRAELWRTAKGR